jgi:hypothetical protein
MNQELIDMAEKCGLLGKEPYLAGMYSNALKAFAALVAAAEREKVEDLLKEYDMVNSAFANDFRARGETK